MTSREAAFVIFATILCYTVDCIKSGSRDQISADNCFLNTCIDSKNSQASLNSKLVNEGCHCGTAAVGD